MLVAGGCADRAIEHAFDGDFPPLKSNKVINEYCESCHIHKDFEAEPHMADMREKYRRPYFHQAQECRACHFIE
ncbi:MAG: hypothetical protein GWM98_13735, partial [Nitrospinaceae bacterium]|nr:hypothetical protein [Nitrospinaceae bacterium]NIR55338.1 hypothetical protein [Nitrospinaceae bacterium]NIS85777.1 hypothetical protein [Nitrospinaceae bacterium]NIT82627.1 hypothetical protein [Nitrospinaceae bacterium]NIU44832.1 hypothetical protein [Nitrospinaceae bacterium]